MRVQSLLLLSTGTAAVGSPHSPTVTISSGVIHGVSTNLPHATAAVNKYLGVPYAAPPRRFSKSEPPQPWTEPLDAMEFGPSCLQNFGIPDLGPRRELVETLFNTPKPPESEDCLSVNIFVPATETPNPGRSVLVFIPGGGWQLGHGRSDLSAFAAYEDVIAITMNYRTNVFGFPSGPEVPVAGRNLGLHDQRLALEWVQENIASFGGDPGKVTIWGESAGSFSVDLHLKAYANDLPPPFHAAIMSSGQMSFGLLAATNPGDEAWLDLSAAVGCANQMSNLACMREVPSERLIDAMRTYKITFGPYTDNVTVLSKPDDLWRSGRVAKVPILTGTVAEEGRGLINDQVNLTAFLEAYLPSSLVPREARDAILSVYRSDPRLASDFDIASAVYTDWMWACPQTTLASTAASRNISTWSYNFNASVLHLLPDEYQWLGKFHGSEITLLFTEPSTTPHTPQSYAVYEYLRGAIARFVKNPAAGPGWAAVGSEHAPLDMTVIGDVGDVAAVAAPINALALGERCTLYKELYTLLEFSLS